ncbi:MAG TPA: glycosyltransferase family 2 protein [Candidatus Nanopelagicaceae bacterium]
MKRNSLIRICVVVTVLLGANYLAWRWFASVNWANWWIALPLVLAETYSLIDLVFFGLTIWRANPRHEIHAPREGLSVDVVITTHDEPTRIVIATADAARKIRYPHQTWILDYGDRKDLRNAAEAFGIGYLTRGEMSTGNFSEALEVTSGEFMLVLEADQVPYPEILDHTLEYFKDPKVAIVQTPCWTGNVTPYDPLGSQTSLFNGPIQQGKNAWNATIYCGSNAVLRREALLPLATDSAAEALATSMKLHARGWRSIYHHENLAVGLEPEDLGAMVNQRLRWAQGSMQALLREKPLTKQGLTIAQRLMYFATLWSYLYGLAALSYFAAPILYLSFGVLPLKAYSTTFLLHFVPFIIANQLLFVLVSQGVTKWRAQQYGFALFPVWLEALINAVRNVHFHQNLPQEVLPPTVRGIRHEWQFIKYQIGLFIVLIFAVVLGILRLTWGRNESIATIVNVIWAFWDIGLLGILIPTLRYRGRRVKSTK